MFRISDENEEHLHVQLRFSRRWDQCKGAPQIQVLVSSRHQSLSLVFGFFSYTDTFDTNITIV